MYSYACVFCDTSLLSAMMTGHGEGANGRRTNKPGLQVLVHKHIIPAGPRTVHSVKHAAVAMSTQAAGNCGRTHKAQSNGGPA